MKKILAILALSLSVAGFGSVHAADVPESNDPIKLAMNEWTGQHITTTIASSLLKEMGYNVELVTAGYYPMLKAIETGDLHAGLEIWYGNVGEGYFDMVSDGKLEEFGHLGIDAGQFWMYPEYLEEQCPGLPDWKALKNCGELFATADTFPRGRFVEYPADWGATGNPERFAALGLDYELVSAGSEGAMVAEIKSAFASKKPLFIFFWKPHWVHFNYKMNKVVLPAFDTACLEDAAWGMNADATHDCGHSPETTVKIGWPGMQEKWPAAHRLLNAFQLTNEDQEGMMKSVDNEGRPLDEVVTEWLAANESRWRAWIEAAKAG
jgi:glycine betaine/proline transport system substrate-binding protein